VPLPPIPPGDLKKIEAALPRKAAKPKKPRRILVFWRADAILRGSPAPGLWIVEDFRRVRLSPPVLRRLARARVRLAAIRALARAPVPRARAKTKGKMAG